MSKYLFASLMTGIRLNIEDPTAADVREAVALARDAQQNHFHLPERLTPPAPAAILSDKQEGNGSPSYIRGGDAMTALEVIGLLNLLAVVIFGVINVTKK